MRTIATALWALIVSQVIPAAAEEPLSLDAAVTRALTDTPQTTAQNAAVEAAQASRESAGRLPDPELVAAIDNLPINTEDRFSFTRDFMTMRRIGVMQQFPNARKRHLQRERGTAGVMLAEAERNLTRFEIAQAVADAWVSRTVAKELEARLSELLPTVELGERGARAALAAGRGSAADALTAQASVTALRDRILETERAAKVAEAALLRWIGEEARRASSALAELRQQPLPPVEALESIHQHATVLPWEARLESARIDVALAQAEKRPDWSAELAFAKRGPDFSDMVNLEFRIGLPLFPKHRQNPLIAEKRANMTRLESEREDETRMHLAEVTAMRVEWQAARERLSFLDRERLPLARERTRTAFAAYRAGRVDLRAVTDAISQEIEILATYVELEGALARAWAYLHYVTAFGRSP